MTRTPRQIVAEDPFWSVVRRRDPDLNVVVLPPAGPRPKDSGRPPQDAPAFAERCAASARDLWCRLLRLDDDADAPPARARWIPGPTRDSVRHEATLTAEDVEPDAIPELMRRTADVLEHEGWHVLVPHTGMPRVTAGHDGELGRVELLLVYVPERRCLALRVDSDGLPVGRDRAGALVGSVA